MEDKKEEEKKPKKLEDKIMPILVGIMVYGLAASWIYWFFCNPLRNIVLIGVVVFIYFAYKDISGSGS